MMGNHVSTSTFISQWLRAAKLFMHVKPDSFVEYNTRTGIDMILKDVQPHIYPEIMQGWRTSLHIWRQQDFKPVCVAEMWWVVVEGFLLGAFFQMCTECAHSARTLPSRQCDDTLCRWVW